MVYNKRIGEIVEKEQVVELVQYFAQTQEVQMYMKYTRLLNELAQKERDASRNEVQEQNITETQKNNK
jgi:hypothetical protein